MTKLRIELNQQYKSFKEGFETELLGDLIILSGVNGSGKTQLIDIIKGHRSTDLASKISRTITQNGLEIGDARIIHKSFRDYSSIGDFSSADASHRNNYSNTIFEWYNSNQFDASPPSDSNKEARKKAKEFLVETFGEEALGNKSIARELIKLKLPRDFILYDDDIFLERIGQIFYNYVSIVYDSQAQAGEIGERFDPKLLPLAPWTQLNDLFSKLELGYRFKDSYKRIYDEIDEQPAIYAVNPDGSINLQDKRSLTELSDGEKALIMLTFGVLATPDAEPQLLLLDEYEATLNPSLVNAFFTIITDFFLKKNVQVVLATHSATTLALAPEIASFYEVYKPREGKPRLLQVQRDQYEELSVASTAFYNKIKDQNDRYEQIEQENIERDNLIQEAAQNNQETLVIMTEGKNTEHIDKAMQMLCPELAEKVTITKGVESRSGKGQLKSAFEIMSKSNAHRLVLFVWDWDAADLTNNLEETDMIKKFCFEKNEDNSKMKKGIENLYDEGLFTSDIYEEIETKLDDGRKIETRVDKSKFLEKIKNLEEAQEFANFDPLINRIRELTR